MMFTSCQDQGQGSGQDGSRRGRSCNNPNFKCISLFHHHHCTFICYPYQYFLLFICHSNIPCLARRDTFVQFFRKFKMIAKYERGVILTFLTTQNIKLASDQTPRTSFPSYVKPPRPTLHASKAPSSLPSILWSSFPSFVKPSPS